MEPLFTRRGYWEMGWEDPDQPDFAALRNQMKPGDRIAIKALAGQGQKHIVIKALGIIKAIDPTAKRVYVDWKLSGLSRKVQSRGEFSTIHEPLSPNKDAARIQEIFTL